MTRILRWRVGLRRYGTKLQDVQEVLPGLPATRIPFAPPEVLGIVNVRGTIHTAVDARRLLQADATVPPEAFLLVRHGDRLVALGVDEVEDVLDVGFAVPADGPVDDVDLGTLLGAVFAKAETPGS